MLPFGWLGPHPGWGESRQSRLPPEEEKTEYTLCCVARSPLVLGANLTKANRTKLDAYTRSLITNQTLLLIDQASSFSRPVEASSLPAVFENARLRRAAINTPGARGYAEYLALFNLDNQPVTLRASWKELGIDKAKHAAEDAWTMDTGKASKEVTVSLPAHGSTVIKVQ
jgi:alpha-galactosidase